MKLCRNEDGFTLLDAMLSLFIWSICALFLLPLYADLRDSLVTAKRDVHVAEAMEHAAKRFVQSGVSSGQYIIDEVPYHYNVQLPIICVRYTAEEKENETCKDFSDETTALHS